MQVAQQPKAEKEIHRYPCPSCGAVLVYEPKDGCLMCPYCGYREQIPTSAEQVEERSFETYLRPRADQLKRLAQNALEVNCDSCGAAVTFTPPEVARECDFCGAPIVAQPKSADPVVAPEAVLPFRVTQYQATVALKGWLSSRWFAPDALKEFAHHESIGGVYLPFWTYDAHTISYYTGERGEHYYVTENYTDTNARGERVTRARQVRRTRWHSASGEVSRWFDDLLIPATRSLPQNRIAALEPWDLAELRAYEPAYLSGFKAQRYQVEIQEGFEQARQMAARVIEADARRDIGGDEQRVHDIKTQYSGVTFKHILLPVYVGAYRFNEKVYQITVNGRTGEIQGERPYSVWKIAFFVILMLFVIGFFLTILSLTGQSN